MKVILDRAGSRGHANHGWLDTKHTFSFADYYNPKRIHFGALRVLNDDTVAPGKGFGMHPHQNMEVISIPLKGYLRHGDNIENSEVITPGDIQVMSAGTGIFHSEYNDSNDEPLEFLQIWVFPKTKDTQPKYANYNIRALEQRDKLAFIISPDGDTPASINQDAWFSLGKLSAGKTIEYKMHKGENGVYIFVIEGEIKLDEELTLSRRDGAGIFDTEGFCFQAMKESEVLLMEVPMSLEE
ncbi:pirin family protein [Parabacteroides pacaensis]|uniref:pirin family protein n=1 Tax=Parabacteroides pacaensis TaxID=2086575 RepID=UPI000D0E4B7B|nr:pirin family protein [Parabacteroides pacaensis]